MLLSLFSLSERMCAPDRAAEVEIPKEVLSKLVPKVGWAWHTPK